MRRAAERKIINDLQLLRVCPYSPLAPHHLAHEGASLMAEVLLQIDAAITGRDGRSYQPRICGREADDGLWEAWIEFEPKDSATVLRTARESKQPNRADLEYWAGGLTVAYLQGA